MRFMRRTARLYFARPQTRLRGHYVEAAWLALSVGTIAHWVKVKNPKAPAVKREGGGGLGPLIVEVQQIPIYRRNGLRQYLNYFWRLNRVCNGDRQRC